MLLFFAGLYSVDFIFILETVSEYIIASLSRALIIYIRYVLGASEVCIMKFGATKYRKRLPEIQLIKVRASLLCKHSSYTLN